MGNARGTEYSRNHTSLNPDDLEFWKFSWHEIGYYDLPAMIDYSLKTAKQRQLVFIGHSQGVTSAMVMLSARPEYNKKIKILHALTVPVIMKNRPLFFWSFPRRGFTWSNSACVGELEIIKSYTCTHTLLNC